MVAVILNSWYEDVFLFEMKFRLKRVALESRNVVSLGFETSFPITEWLFLILEPLKAISENQNRERQAGGKALFIKIAVIGTPKRLKSFQWLVIAWVSLCFELPSKFVNNGVNDSNMLISYLGKAILCQST